MIELPMYGFFAFRLKTKSYKKRLIISLLFVLIFFVYIFSFPAKLISNDYSTVLLDDKGNLLGATIASDGQWRFPQQHRVPEKFITCLVQFEDRYFFQHPGFNPFSLSRALKQNVMAGKTVSGGSTISMQVIRMHRNEPRTYLEKFLEIILATRLELSHSKQEILSLYASHAPFGGNVVGLDAAAWRYFGRSPEELSWGEFATLAVLPNSPALVHPGRNRDRLFEKRNRLLQKLLEEGLIDSLTCQLSQQEMLPDKPLPLPAQAPHLLQRARKEGKNGQIIHSTIQSVRQKSANETIANFYAVNQQNYIHNASVCVIENKSGNVVAYVGNTPGENFDNGQAVDVITAPRSTGSILKPFLFAAMVDEGELLPSSLVKDVPTFIDGFMPQNFSRSYDGAIAASEALARSLNIPAVHMLRQYKIEKFHFLLNRLGLQTITRPANEYGLSLILGGAEASLWDLTAAYASMARVLSGFEQRKGDLRYYTEDFRANNLYKENNLHQTNLIKGNTDNQIFSASAIWSTFQSMLDVHRPPEEASWNLFDSSRKIAWKTGTSFGFRDAWAIGVTPEYTVGVWVGNASGEGRPGITGVEAAGPILFDVYSRLPETSWFTMPIAELVEIEVCAHSGYRVGQNCEKVRKIMAPQGGLRTSVCNFCQLIHLHPTVNQQVTDDCLPVAEMRHESWFLLPPLQEWYYAAKNPLYKRLPSFFPGCQPNIGQKTNIEIVYPIANGKIFIPKELDGTMGMAVFEASHRQPAKAIHWHLDQEYVGSTKQVHKLTLRPEKGLHRMLLVDEDGLEVEINFTVLSSDNEQ
ncbi:MAG: penicillin-binding protein 1C [Cyclobacteriaceae bacterium]